MKRASSSCMCFYDAGHLPGFDVLGENAEEKWSRDTRGSGQGEVRDADGTVGVGCYEMVVEEAVSFFFFFFLLLLLLLLPDQGGSTSCRTLSPFNIRWYQMVMFQRSF